jgi:hypothetical protein
MLGYFQDETIGTDGDLDLKGVENLRKLVVELNIDDGSNDLCDLSIEKSGGAAVRTHTGYKRS